MTNKMLFSIATVAGAALLPATAQAEVPAGATVINPASTTRLAPVGGSPMPRLRRTDEFQPGNEMPSVVMSGKQGLYFVATGEINGQRANRRIQGGLIPFTLVNEGGVIKGVPDMTKATFITDNDGNEYRQFNASKASKVTIGGTDYAVVRYNFQPQGTNDTKRYLQVFKMDGTLVLGQTQFFNKNNDDCSMSQDGEDATFGPGSTPDSIMMYAYEGCNGNGSDDGWVSATELKIPATGTASIKRVWDVSVCPREERSRGTVRMTKDMKGVIVSWTEGNTQPQRDGVWMAALDLTKPAQGANQQQLIAWKEQIDGRVDQDGIRTYSMRMKIEQLADNTGAIDNKFLVEYGHLRGNNNTNGKGGTYFRNMVGVVEADVSGLKYVQPMTDIGNTAMAGIDATHLGQVYGNFGTSDKPVPGFAFLSGNHFGGGLKSSIRVVTFDSATSTFKNAGTLSGAPHDRHLYPNYLGNNPGNQGRNHSHGQVIDNPFLAEGSTATKLLVYATTAKDTGGAGGATTSQLDNPAITLAAWLSVIPVQTQAAQPADPTPPAPTDPTDPTDPSQPEPTDPGTSLGGCSSTGGAAGGLSFLLIGLAAFIRRRR